MTGLIKPTMDIKTLAAYASIACAISHHARGKSKSDTEIWRKNLDKNEDWIKKQGTEYQKRYSELKGNEIVYGHEFMRTFEETSEALKSFDILEELDGYYSLIVSDPAQDYQLAISNRANGPTFDELLGTFVALFGDFGTDFYGSGNAVGIAFKPEVPVLASAMEALIPLGYAEAIDGGFRWTDKIRGFWPIE